MTLGREVPDRTSPEGYVLTFATASFGGLGTSAERPAWASAALAPMLVVGSVVSKSHGFAVVHAAKKPELSGSQVPADNPLPVG